MDRAGTRSNRHGTAAGRDTSLLDLVDNLLNRGVLLNGELMISLANVDLVYVRLSVLLCAADFVLPSGEKQTQARLRLRRQARQAAEAG
jgi:hypothetical protein